jgi:hypothetical protein
MRDQNPVKLIFAVDDLSVERGHHDVAAVLAGTYRIM